MEPLHGQPEPETETESDRSTSPAAPALRDALTGLPNRLLLLDRMSVALARAQRSGRQPALLLLDLDRFKLINDSFGAEVGDHVLQTAAERLCTVLRPGDTVARFGDDEFAMLCEDVASELDATGIADRLLAILETPIEVGDTEVYLTASLGIAMPRVNSTRPDDVLADAGVALFRAKERGRACWELFDDTMRVNTVQVLRTQSALHRALDRAEFRVHYQPIYRVVDGYLRTVEALVRWEHPDLGLVPPSDFIPQAEESGVIIPLGEWVLRESFGQVVALSHLRGEPVGVAVNVSGRQLSDPRFVDRVAQALEATSIEPRQVSLEITESVLVDDVAMVAAVIDDLKAIGVRVGIDDFGAGYSSLAYLKHFNVDILKMDKSLAEGLGAGQRDGAIVRAVVDMARALGMLTVAEGVERDEQLRELEVVGCHFAQGFLLARPMPMDAIRDLLLTAAPAPDPEPARERPVGATR